MTTFVILSWFCCLITSILVFGALWRYRFLIIKPSMIVIIFFHLTTQWAAAVQSPDIESYLPKPYVFALLAHGFPFFGFLISFFTLNRSAQVIWWRIGHPQYVFSRIRNRAIFILGGCVFFLVALYLSIVPFSSTGLYAILIESADAEFIREDSLKLLNNALVKYGYLFMAGAFSPLLIVLLAKQLAHYMKRKRLAQTLVIGLVIAGVLVAVSLSGARISAASLILTLLFALFFRKGLPFKPLHFLVAAVIVLALPTVFSILREDQPLSLSNFGYYLTIGGIFERVFIIPIQMGLWHVHYAQTVGFFGIQGIPKLATLFGSEPIYVAHFIGLRYANSPLPMVQANTSYVFSYYSFFGLLSFPFSLAGLWFLDVVTLWVYRKLSDNLLLACSASVSMASYNFTSGDYTTVLISSGFAILLIVALVVDRLSHFKIKIGFNQTDQFRSNRLSLAKASK